MTEEIPLSLQCSEGDHHLCRPDLHPCGCKDERCMATHAAGRAQEGDEA